MNFNQQKFCQLLRELSTDQNWDQLKFYHYQITDSTNQQLWQLIDQGNQGFLVAIASQQTAGRGQWGRRWLSELGGLYLSVAITPNLSVNNASHLTICTAYGVANILRNYHIPVCLKWPNDLFLENRKLGGIKTETRIYQKNITHAIIGIGINWNNPIPKNGITLKSFLNNHQDSEINSLEMLAAITLIGLWQGYQYYLQVGINSLLTNYLELLIENQEDSF
jgi:BirA family biotin operon repressor/biotin-[acetyl-CoA-carboxylase] ligase